MNPAAGGGRAKRILPRVADYLSRQGFSADFAEPRSAGDFRRCAAAAAGAGYGCVAALGGDGTFQQLVRGALGTDLILGLLPAGGGNDVAAALGLPQDPVAAAHVFLHSQARPMDVLRARFDRGNADFYVGGGGLGLDAQAARLASGKFRGLPGAARYIAGALWALAAFQPFGVEAELDSGTPQAGGKTERATVSGTVLLAAVANTPTYGAGVKIAPCARVDDGLLELVLVGALPWTRLVEVIPMMLRTGDVPAPEVRRFRARRVVLRADRPVLFHGDGEVFGEAPVEIENLPGAIRVVAPPGR